MTSVPAARPSDTGFSLAERWYRLRDRLLRDPAFQRAATAFPGTRWLARRRARESFDLVAGFVYSQLLHAVVKLRLLQTLAPGPLPVEDIAQATGLPLDSARRLCAGAAALRICRSAPAATGSATSGRRCSAIPASSPWWSTTRSSTRICATRSRCCASPPAPPRSPTTGPMRGAALTS